jgi:hypothetical protein
MSGGARLVAPLRTEELASLDVAPKFLMSDDAQGRPMRGPFQRWFPEGSTFDTYERWMEIELRIRQLHLRRRRGRPIVIMDWGTANGRFLRDLSAKLEEWGIGDVVLLGTSHQYYDSWQTLPSGITMLFGRMEHYIEYLAKQDLRIDLVVSHFALFELGLSQSKRKLLDHLNALAPFLSEGAEIVFTGNVSGSVAVEVTTELFREHGFNLRVRNSRHLKRQSRPRIGGAIGVRSVQASSPEPYQYNVLTRGRG